MTPRQEEARRLALAGLTVNEIAEQMYCSRQTVYSHLKATGTLYNSRPKPTDVEIISMYEGGMNDEEIMNLTGLSHWYLLRVRRRSGVKDRVGGTPPVLTPVEVERLLLLARQGLTQINLAKEFGISQNTISKYLIKYGLRRQTKRTTKQ